MKPTVVLLIAALAIAAAAPAVAQEPTPAPSAPTITLTTDQFAALVAKTSAGPGTPVVSQPAAAVPAISADGVLGFSWGTVVMALLSLAGVIGTAFKITAMGRVKGMVVDLADAAYWWTERNLGDLPGPQKFLASLGKAYQDATGHGVTLSAKQVQALKTRWDLLAAQNPGQSGQDRAPAPVAPPAKDLAAATAAAEVSKQQAAGATAADLLKQAGQG